MCSRRTTALLTVLATVFQHTAAQILSCADVECPISQGTTAADCIVAGESFNAVGVADLSIEASGFDGLSWTKAVGAGSGGSSDQRLFTQNFYLGHPLGFNPDTGACALFFSRVSDRVKFGDGSPKLSEGTCAQAMTESCVNALIKRANSLDLGSAGSTEAACEKLQNEFSDNLDSECASFATGSRWAGITARPLSGAASPKAITSETNSTSNCWPTLPKSNDLTLVETFNSTGDFQASTLTSNFFGITPILTVLFPGSDNSTAVVTQPEAQLTCVKAIDLTTASRDTQSPKDENDKSNDGGFHLSGSSLPVMWTSIMSVFFFVLLG